MMIMPTRNTTRTVFAMLLLLTLSQAVAGAHVFQPAVSVIAVSSNSLRGGAGGKGGGGALTKNQKQQQQQQKQKQCTSSKPQKEKDKLSLATSSSAVSSLAQHQQQQQVEVLQRSTVVAISCVTTWAMATQHIPGIIKNPIQAASLQGLLACAICAILPRILTPTLVLPGVAFCAASFCGAVAGMSTQISTLGEASLLGLLCSIVYYIFERPNKKLQLGKGGRLGTIAFLANVVYFGIRKGYSQFPTLLMDVIDRLQLENTVAVVLAAIVLNIARSSRVQKQQLVWTSNTLEVDKLVANTSKAFILAVLLARVLQITASNDSTTSSAATAAAMTLVPLAKSTLAMLAASLVVQKSKPFTILPVALTGLIGATLFEMNVAAPLFLGAFIGMTGLPQFTIAKIVQASVMSAILLQLGLIAGFGGRLGVLAFVGVNFGL